MSKFSELKDKAMNMAGRHDDQVDQGLEKAGDMANDKTGGKYDSQIDSAVEKGQNAT